MAGNVLVHRLPVRKHSHQHWRAGELGSWTWWALGYAARLSRERRFGLCHCWAGWPSGLVGYRLRHRLPYVVSLRGSDVPGYNERLRRLDPLVMSHVSRRVWSRAARIVAVSRNLRNLAYATSPEAIIDVIPNGVDVGFFTPGPAQAGGLLFVGRLIERKGVHLLIEAVAGLAAGQPTPTLTIVGDGPERQRLEAMTRRLGLSDRIAFRGQLGREALAAAYRDAAILVLPAVTDAMPNVVLEAMASGLAIVTTRTGGAELVQGNGVVVDRADPESLRAAIAGYVAAPDLLATHREASRRLAQGLSWRAVGSYFLDVYGEVMAMSAGRSASIPAREFQLPAG